MIRKSISHYLFSVTFCNRQFEPDNFASFDDIMEAIKKTQQNNYLAKIVYFSHHLWYETNISDANQLKKYWNKEMEEIWSHGPHMQLHFPFSLIICTTLNLTGLGKHRDMSVQLHLYLYDQTGSGIFYIEKHQQGQSLYPYGFDKTDNFYVTHAGKGDFKTVTTEETISLKKSTYDCYEDNSMKKQDCINDFIAEELDCKLPWATYKGSSKLEECEGTEKFKEFKILSRDIKYTNLTEKLKKKGCFKPNCITYKWLTKFHEHWDLNDPSNRTYSVILFEITSQSNTIVRKEIRLADFWTFLADCGSYLGLFLGASVLSLSETAVSLLKTVNDLVKVRKASHDTNRN